MVCRVNTYITERQLEPITVAHINWMEWPCLKYGLFVATTLQGMTYYLSNLYLADSACTLRIFACFAAPIRKFYKLSRPSIAARQYYKTKVSILSLCWERCWLSYFHLLAVLIYACLSTRPTRTVQRRRRGGAGEWVLIYSDNPKHVTLNYCPLKSPSNLVWLRRYSLSPSVSNGRPHRLRLKRRRWFI